jgi:putative peptidoglycan lipid II flippase
LFATRIAIETFELATAMVRIIVWSAIPILLAGIFRAYLQINNMFFVAISSDAMISIFVIVSIISGKITNHLLLMGFGVTLGNFASLAILVFFCRKKNLRYHPVINLKDGNLHTMIHQTFPVLIANAVVELNQIVDKNLASMLPVGTVSSLNYAIKITGVMLAIIGRATSIALFPKISELAVEGETLELKKNIMNCINGLIPLLLPLTIGVMLLAEPIIRILLERGAFVPEATRRTAECLQMYAIGMLASNLNPLLARAFYAMRLAKLSATLSSISVGFGIILNFIFVGPFKHRGLALASSISISLSSVLLLFAMRKHIGALGFRSFVPELCKTAIASGIMGIFVWFAASRCALLDKTYLGCFLWTSLIVVAAVLLYGVVLIAMRSEWMRGIIAKASYIAR